MGHAEMNHVQTPSQGSITVHRTASGSISMDIVDFGIYASVLSSFSPARCQPSSGRPHSGFPDGDRTSKRPCHCLAASSPASPFREAQLLLERLSQSAAFRTPGYQPGTARTTGGSREPSRISDDFTPEVTLLGGPTSTPSLHVPASRQATVSASASRRFLGHETRSVPLSASDGFSRFGTVSIRSLLPSAFAPFMFEIFAAGFFAQTPELAAPVPTVASRKLPTRARLSGLERPNPL